MWSASHRPGTATPPGAPSFEDRLHIAAFTDREIKAALAEKLPANWVALHEKGSDTVYYWNQVRRSA